MSSIWIEAKVGGGTRVEDAAREACDLAARLGCAVRFDFSGVSCWTEPYGVRPEEFTKRILCAMDAGGKHPSCTNRVMPSESETGKR